jgi:hypothetical protein
MQGGRRYWRNKKIKLVKKMSCGEAKEGLLHFHEVWRIKHGPRNEGLVDGGAGSQLAMEGIGDNTEAPTVARTLTTEEPSTMEDHRQHRRLMIPLLEY